MINAIELDKIKEFAHSQLGMDNPAVSVTDGEFDIADPWYSATSAGRYLTDKEAEAEWGKELVDEFIAKASEYLARKTVNEK